MRKSSEEIEYSNLNPTDVIEVPYLKARRANGDYPPSTERCGKWIIYLPLEEVNEQWHKIKEATDAGRLGCSAKVATLMPNPLTVFPDKRVVCVYTYDGDDEGDVMQVRQALREIGFTWKFGWKHDSATLQQQYHRQGKPVSRYWA